MVVSEDFIKKVYTGGDIPLKGPLLTPLPPRPYNLMKPITSLSNINSKIKKMRCNVCQSQSSIDKVMGRNQKVCDMCETIITNAAEAAKKAKLNANIAALSYAPGSTNLKFPPRPSGEKPGGLGNNPLSGISNNVLTADSKANIKAAKAANNAAEEEFILAQKPEKEANELKRLLKEANEEAGAGINKKIAERGSSNSNIKATYYNNITRKRMTENQKTQLNNTERKVREVENARQLRKAAAEAARAAPGIGKNWQEHNNNNSSWNNGEGNVSNNVSGNKARAAMKERLIQVKNEEGKNVWIDPKNNSVYLNSNATISSENSLGGTNGNNKGKLWYRKTSKNESKYLNMTKENYNAKKTNTKATRKNRKNRRSTRRSTRTTRR